MRTRRAVCLLAAAVILLTPIRPCRAGTHVTGSVTLNISGALLHPSDPSAMITCTMTVQTNDPLQNLSIADQPGQIGSQTFSCTVVMDYDWVVESTASIATLSYSVLYQSSSGNATVQQTLISGHIPPNGSNALLSVSTKL
jgi:hypothetical protein